MGESEEYEYRTFWKDWHLTPAGWVAGSYTVNSDDEPTIVARPADALKTVRVTAHTRPRLGVIYEREDTWEKRGNKKAIRAIEKTHTNGWKLTA